MSRITGNIVGFDDAPFAHSHRGNIAIIGTVFSRTRLDGVLKSEVRRDGINSTKRMIEMVTGSQFDNHIGALLLQGIAVAGFNVVDIHGLYKTLRRPVLVVARRQPDMDSIRRALLTRVKGGKAKWKLVQKAGIMEPLRGIYIQRVGLSLEQADRILALTTLHGKIPEALRVAHLIAGGITDGVSRGRA